MTAPIGYEAVGFDGGISAVDIDSYDYATTGTLPIGILGGERHSSSRNRQRPRRPLTDADHM